MQRRERFISSLNPLCCSRTALPPQVLLAAKMIIVGLLLKGYVPRIPGIYIPMLPMLDLVPRPELVQLLMQATVAICGVMLLCNRAVRSCAFVIGTTYIFATLASRGFYSNGRLFCSSMLVLIGLYSGGRSIWPIRWQLVLLYFGSGLNKITQADWRSGWYFEYWMHGILDRDWYTTLAAALPPMALSQFFCWATIVMEFSIATGLAVPRLYRLGIWLALLFHFGAVAATGMMFGIFVIAITFSLLVFVDWPSVGEIAIVRTPTQGALRLFLTIAERLDFDRVLDPLAGRAQPTGADEAGTLTVRRRDRTYLNSAAVRRIALSLPVTYFLAALALILPSLYLRWLGP
jgi:hypothetical protein